MPEVRKTISVWQDYLLDAMCRTQKHFSLIDFEIARSEMNTVDDADGRKCGTNG
jgi:hypothetical protein